MSAKPVIFFDGICNLCHASVQFVMAHDKKNMFKFTALQGDYAAAILPGFNVDPAMLGSTLLLENGKLYNKSSCALRVARHLNGFWPLLYGFMIVPKFIRDRFYDVIAKNRYRWFGKQESCWIPTPELEDRFYS